MQYDTPELDDGQHIEHYTGENNAEAPLHTRNSKQAYLAQIRNNKKYSHQNKTVERCSQSSIHIINLPEALSSYRKGLHQVFASLQNVNLPSQPRVKRLLGVCRATNPVTTHGGNYKDMIGVHYSV